jgi:hypothetical protein
VLYDAVTKGAYNTHKDISNAWDAYFTLFKAKDQATGNKWQLAVANTAEAKK